MSGKQHTYGDAPLRTSEGSDEASAEPTWAMRTHPGAHPWASDHPVNVRLSVPVFFGRYYVTIVAGKERRSPERRNIELRRHPLLTFGNVIFLAGIGVVVGLALFVLLKWATLTAFEQSGSLIRSSSAAVAPQPASPAVAGDSQSTDGNVFALDPLVP